MEYWHQEPYGEAHASLFTVARLIEEDQQWRWTAHKAYASMYRDKRVSGFSPGKWARGRSSSAIGPGLPEYSSGAPLTYNVVRSCIDTMQAKICMSRPMPKILTSNASAKKRAAARALERFVWGVMMYNRAHEVLADCFRDCSLYGDGYPYVRVEGKRIVIEKIHPSNVLVDDSAAMGGASRSALHRDWYSRDDLLAIFPEKEKAIRKAEKDSDASSGMQRDLVRVVQGWWLPKCDVEGRHVIAVNDATLMDAEWSAPRFPLSPMRWSRDIAGWHGIGLAEELMAIQGEINRTIGMISDNVSLFANPYLLNPRSSGVVREHWLSNEPGRMLDYDGPQPPSVVTPPAISEQVFSYLEQLYRRAFEITGISLLDATSQKPSGLYSGAALNTYLDVTTQRFSQKQRTFEQAVVDVSWNIIDAAKHAESLDGVHFVDAESGESGYVDFSELDLDDDMIEVQIYPASSLTKDMAGRIQDVVNLVQAGVVDQPNAAQLLADPDLDKFTRLNNAPMEDLQMIFESMLDGGDYIAPLAYQDCSLGIKVATRYWARARVQGVDEERTGLLEIWMKDASDLLASGQGKPPAPLPAPEQSANPMAMPAMPAMPAEGVPS